MSRVEPPDWIVQIPIAVEVWHRLIGAHPHLEGFPEALAHFCAMLAEVLALKRAGLDPILSRQAEFQAWLDELAIPESTVRQILSDKPRSTHDDKEI